MTNHVFQNVYIHHSNAGQVSGRCSESARKTDLKWQMCFVNSSPSPNHNASFSLMGVGVGEEVEKGTKNCSHHHSIACHTPAVSAIFFPQQPVTHFPFQTPLQGRPASPADCGAWCRNSLWVLYLSLKKQSACQRLPDVLGPEMPQYASWST